MVSALGEMLYSLRHVPRIPRTLGLDSELTVVLGLPYSGLGPVLSLKTGPASVMNISENQTVNSTATNGLSIACPSSVLVRPCLFNLKTGPASVMNIPESRTVNSTAVGPGSTGGLTGLRHGPSDPGPDYGNSRLHAR